MNVEIYKSGYTQKWVVLLNGRFSGHFNTKEEAINFSKEF